VSSAAIASVVRIRRRMASPVSPDSCCAGTGVVGSLDAAGVIVALCGMWLSGSQPAKTGATRQVVARTATRQASPMTRELNRGYNFCIKDRP
jgi:hypothetical protein